MIFYVLGFFAIIAAIVVIIYTIRYCFGKSKCEKIENQPEGCKKAEPEEEEEEEEEENAPQETDNGIKKKKHKKKIIISNLVRIICAVIFVFASAVAMAVLREYKAGALIILLYVGPIYATMWKLSNYNAIAIRLDGSFYYDTEEEYQRVKTCNLAARNIGWIVAALLTLISPILLYIGKTVDSVYTSIGISIAIGLAIAFIALIINSYDFEEKRESKEVEVEPDQEEPETEEETSQVNLENESSKKEYTQKDALKSCIKLIDKYDIEFFCNNPLLPSCKNDIVEIIDKIKKNSNKQSMNQRVEDIEKASHVILLNLTYDLLQSGKYNLYNSLDPLGCGLSARHLNNKCLDWLVEKGHITEEEADDYRKTLSQRISEVG